MANILFEAPGRTRMTQYSATTVYDIADINFYVTNTSFGNAIQVFALIQGEKGLTDIVELSKAGASGSNVCYRVPINQTLRIKEELCDVKILVLNYDKGLYWISGNNKLYITTQNYLLARQIYIAQEVGQKVQDAYAKILSMTQQNAEIYNKLQKGVNT